MYGCNAEHFRMPLCKRSRGTSHISRSDKMLLQPLHNNVNEHLFHCSALQHSSDDCMRGNMQLQQRRLPVWR